MKRTVSTEAFSFRLLPEILTVFYFCEGLAFFSLFEARVPLWCTKRRLLQEEEQPDAKGIIPLARLPVCNSRSMMAARALLPSCNKAVPSRVAVAASEEFDTVLERLRQRPSRELILALDDVPRPPPSHIEYYRHNLHLFVAHRTLRL